MERKPSDKGKFYLLGIDERLNALKESCNLSLEALLTLKEKNTLTNERLERIGENPISTYELPLRIANYFQVNGKYYFLPYVIEEASVVAGACYGAKTLGNIEANVIRERSYAKSQVQLIKVNDLDRAQKNVSEKKEELLEIANSGHRHSRAFDLKTKAYRLRSGNCLVVDLYVDPGNAMGAAVSSEMAERIAPTLAELTGGTYNGRIISNYSGRLTRAIAKVPVERLETKAKLGNKEVKWSGEEVMERIIWLYEWAEVDEERAVTYNKGIMNGVDSIAIATCQDFRAIEAANHLHAMRTGKYRPLSKWYEKDGYLVGELELLIPCGIVGGEIEKYPKAKVIINDMLRLKSADELAELMGAAGLANNFAAQRMLATFGISLGHRPLR